jgi:ribonuclease J
VRPRVSIPVHGERRHIVEHAAYAKSLQVQSALTPRNGSLMRLAPGEPVIIDEVPAGRLMLDGSRLVPEAAEGLIERRRLSVSGLILATVCLDDSGDIVDGPVIAVKGLSESDGRIADESLEPLDVAAAKALDGIKKRDRMDDEVIEKVVGRALRKACEIEFGIRPLIEVIVLRS